MIHKLNRWYKEDGFQNYETLFQSENILEVENYLNKLSKKVQKQCKIQSFKQVRKLTKKEIQWGKKLHQWLVVNG